VGLFVVAVLTGCGAPGVSSGPGEGSTEQIVVCESGIVAKGNVSTSSAVASRVPAGTPVPPGCRLA
jgi:hypothetical protein